MTKCYKLVALVAALAASAGAGTLGAQAQMQDQSGAMTLQFAIAKNVEFISHAPGSHNVADMYQGVKPGGTIAMPDGHVTREFRANTPYKLSLLGVTEEHQIRFVNAASGDEVRLEARCRTWDTQAVANGQTYSDWSCLGSDVFQPRQSGWASLSLTLANAPYVRAGVYTATVYFQIEAL